VSEALLPPGQDSVDESEHFFGQEAVTSSPSRTSMPQSHSQLMWLSKYNREAEEVFATMKACNTPAVDSTQRGRPLKAVDRRDIVLACGLLRVRHLGQQPGRDNSP
jgi:hypothetical protein